MRSLVYRLSDVACCLDCFMEQTLFGDNEDVFADATRLADDMSAWAWSIQERCRSAFR